MSDTARIIVSGRMGKPLDLRYSAKGTAYGQFSLASSYKGKDDFETSWFEVVLFGDRAEAFNERNLPKGTPIVVVGNFRVEAWANKDGQERRTPKIMADWVDVIAQPEKSPEKATEAVSEEEPFSDKIPF